MEETGAQYTVGDSHRVGRATPLHPADQEADRAVTQTQGDIPTLSVTTGGTGGDAHQSDPARVGELTSRFGHSSRCWLRSPLGREEDTATPDAGSPSPWIWLEEVEYEVAV